MAVQLPRQPRGLPGGAAGAAVRPRGTQRALDFARANGVLPVAALGNESTDLGNPTVDDTSPDFPLGTARRRTVDNSCITVPTESNGVVAVSALGPSGRKAFYSNFGAEQTDVSAPGGDSREGFGTPAFNVPENRVLSALPRNVAEAQRLLWHSQHPAGAA